MSAGDKKLFSKQSELKTSITEASSDFTGKEDTAIDESETQTDLDQLESWWSKFEVNHDSLAEGNADGKLSDSPYFVERWHRETYQVYRSYKGALLRTLKKFHDLNKGDCATPSINSTISHQHSLPKLALPKFSGKYEEWTSFHDRFKSLVGDGNLAPVKKLQYLISCLIGDAAKLLSNIPLQDDNYERAMEKLRLRFENKRSIINAHLDTLFCLKTITKKCARSLESLRSTVATTIEALETLGGKPNEYFLVYVVSKKLDVETQEAWEISIGASAEPPSYSALDAFLASRVRALESLGTRSVATPAKPQPERQSYQAPGRGARVNTTTRSAPRWSAPSAPRGPPLQCVSCGENHLLFRCPGYLSKTQQQRHQFLEESNRCLNCFSTKHSHPSCTSLKRCIICNQAHHTTIHDHVAAVLNPSAQSFAPSGNQVSANAAPSWRSSSQPGQAQGAR